MNLLEHSICKKCFTLSFFVIILYLLLAIGFSIPQWIYIPVAVISILSLVFYILRATVKIKNELDTNLMELKNQLYQHKAEIVNLISETQQRIFESEREFAGTLKNHIKVSSDKTLEFLNAQNKEIREQSLQQIEKIRSLEQTLETLYAQMKSQISYDFEKTETQINDINNSIARESRDIKENCRTQNTQLKNCLDDNIKQTNDYLSKQIDQIDKRLSEGINTCVSASSNKLIENINIVRNENTESSLRLMTEFGQQFKAFNEEMSEKSDDIVGAIDNSRNIICDSINEGTKISLEKTIEFETKILSAVEDGVDIIKENNEKHSTNILQSTQNGTSQVTHDIGALMRQNADLQSTISENSKNIIGKSDRAYLAVCNTKDELASIVRQNRSDLENCITISGSSIQSKIESKLLEGQKLNDVSTESILQNSREQVNSLIERIEKANNDTTAMLKDAASAARQSEIKMAEISEQCERIYKDVGSVETKAHNIEETILLISEDNSKEEIGNAIKSQIIELRNELKNIVSDINDKILDSQIYQRTELDKLQILLRTFLSSDLAGKIISNKDTKENTQYATHPNVSKVNPNRTETILDEVTKNVVDVEYKEGKIVKSIMKDIKGHKLYELEYVNNRIAKSRNFDVNGNLTIEQIYYDNGQVHYRNEYIKGRKKTTEFEINGKKK